MIDLPVLVLNQSYEPLNICRVRRAITLVSDGKAEMLENGTGFIHTSTQTFSVPSVIRLAYMVKRPRHQPKLTRFEVFNRDQYICQYCGKEVHQPTIDHVIPRHVGGKHTWENVVSACVPCNRHKAGKTLDPSGMKLIHIPAPPRYKNAFFIPRNYCNNRKEWQKYIAR